MLLPKENLLNVEVKIFFSELASRRIQYLKQNYLINTTIQKAWDALDITAYHDNKSGLQSNKGPPIGT